jgi:hypothetical protein
VRLNGLRIVVDMAVAHLGDPEVTRRRDALLLGSLREDVAKAPFVGIYEHLSASHFFKPPLPGGFVPFLWPGPRLKADRFFSRAVAAHRAGRIAEGFVWIGRALHLLTDMACPVHVHRIFHETDPYEWVVEFDAPELSRLPVPEPPFASKASDLIERLASRTARHRADATNHVWGRFFERRGWRRGLTTAEARAQAREIIPDAASHAASLLRLYLQKRA